MVVFISVCWIAWGIIWVVGDVDNVLQVFGGPVRDANGRVIICSWCVGMGFVQTNSDDDGSSSVDFSKRNLEKLFVVYKSCSKVDDPVLNTDGWVEKRGIVADVVRSQVKSSPITEGLEGILETVCMNPETMSYLASSKLNEGEAHNDSSSFNFHVLFHIHFLMRRGLWMDWRDHPMRGGMDTQVLSSVGCASFI